MNFWNMVGMFSSTVNSVVDNSISFGIFCEKRGIVISNVIWLFFSCSCWIFTWVAREDGLELSLIQCSHYKNVQRHVCLKSLWCTDLVLSTMKKYFHFQKHFFFQFKFCLYFSWTSSKCLSNNISHQFLFEFQAFL